ncbi:Oligosaccaryltransferase-domain-containing protein [Delphinella strobiligena]|nr:Oligosaccaryltransferase-domain-containing protein [Delphinella strobiligena]
MITDAGLYTLSIFLGSAAMLSIVAYHFLEVNSEPDSLSPLSTARKADTVPGAKAIKTNA